ncbi:FkbM family methyltransferase [Roseococcus pinisoli]|uniref:FkbM family methyltransferase n=1 Tax=Roseococcus pinisoli TaxID=2835040 RepID=A0ABS5QGG7_9PROT|nr:FkbM family methyltransferase [Roseococcus pinisoli]MBS7812032.1 FkbM family methyltransferase [Roseococcus pinisoli]
MRAAISPGLKDLAIRAACAACATYLQRMPGQLGKVPLWDRVVTRHLLWRQLDIEARSSFGARFAGSFPDSVHGFLYFFGVWEPAITALYRAALRPGDTVVDIGANVGTHALLAAHLVGPEGQVHAVEASPWIHARLRQNLETNRVRNVTTYNMAATAEPGEVTVFLHDGTNLGGTTIVASEAARVGAAREAVVEGRPIADIVPLEALLAARLIKIDVEGAEWLVLQGMRDLLPRLRQEVEILVEVNPGALAQFGASLEDFLAPFKAAGFEPFEIANPYEGRFYIERPAPFCRPLGGSSGTLDLGFRRP